MENRQQNRKRTGLLAALALCCILAVGGGVMAWFSAQDSKTNTFAQGGGVTEPDNKPDPTDPTKPSETPNESTDGNIIETEWNENSPLTPNSITPKNPNMGIGPKSAPAYVFAMVENSLPDGSYFVLGNRWKPVDGYCAEYSGAKNPAITDPAAKLYQSGLFVFTGDGTEWEMLAPTTVSGGTKDGYTGELFDKVYTNDTFNTAGVVDKANSIKVSAYFAAASVDSDYDATSGNTQLTAEVKKEILANVQEWAKNVKKQ